MSLLYQKKYKTKMAMGIIALASIATTAQAANVSERVGGRIVLQVESAGEAWYVHPLTLQRHDLGRPSAALATLRTTALGIRTADLAGIPVGIIAMPNTDDADGDGLSDRLEHALGTNAKNRDTDGDGYDDATEIIHGYDPATTGTMRHDTALTQRLAGRILLQVEGNGEAWYLDPITNKRYYLGTPADALYVLRQRGLGISNADLATISRTPTSAETDTTPTTQPTTTNTTPEPSAPSGAQETLNAIAQAVASGATQTLANYTTDAALDGLLYTVEFLDAGGRTTFAEIIQTAQPEETTSNTATFMATVPFNGSDASVRMRLEKNETGTWLLTSLSQ